MRYTLVIAVMFLLVSIAQARVPGKFYEVVKGDWLSKISLREYGTINAWKTLVKWNRQIPDGNWIYYGEKIFIPHRSVLGGAGQHVTQHTVQAGPGDTYKSISARIFGLDKRWRAIAKWNGHKGLYRGAPVKFFGARPGIAMAETSREDEHMQESETSEMEESEELSVGDEEEEEALAAGETDIEDEDTEALETGSIETDEAAQSDTPLEEDTDASEQADYSDSSEGEKSRGFSTGTEAAGKKAKSNFIWLSIAFVFGLIIIVGIFLYLRKRRQNEQLGLSPGEESLPLDETGDRPVFFEEVRPDEQTAGTEIEEMSVEELAEEDTEVHNEPDVEKIAEAPLATLELDKNEVINGSTPGEASALEEFAPQFEIIDEAEEKPSDETREEEAAGESVEHPGEEIATINDTGVMLNDSVLIQEDTQLEEVDDDQLPEESPERVEDGTLQESETVLEAEPVEEAEELLPEEPMSEEDEPIVGMEVGADEESNREIPEGIVGEEGIVESIDVQMNAIDGQIKEIEEEHEEVVEPDIADSVVSGEESQVGEVNEGIGENIRDSVIPLGEAILREEDREELEAPTIIEKDEDLVTEAMEEDVEKPGNVSNEDEDLNEKIAEAVLEGDVTGDYNRYAPEEEEVPAGILGDQTLGESIATDGELLGNKIAEAVFQDETEELSLPQMKTQEQTQPKFEPAAEAGQEEGYTDAVEAEENEEEHHDPAIPSPSVEIIGEVPDSVPHDGVSVREPISFKKSDMVQLVMEKFDLSYSSAQEAVSEIFEIMTGGLKEHGNVRLRELFHMSIKKNRKYKGRNPRTGAEIVVPSKKVIHFKMGKELFELVNENE